MDRGVEEPLAPTLGALAVAGILCDVGPEFEEPRHTLASSRRKNQGKPRGSSAILPQNIDTRIWKNPLTDLCDMPIV